MNAGEQFFQICISCIKMTGELKNNNMNNCGSLLKLIENEYGFVIAFPPLLNKCSNKVLTQEGG